jgi:hypothetical protein
MASASVLDKWLEEIAEEAMGRSSTLPLLCSVIRQIVRSSQDDKYRCLRLSNTKIARSIAHSIPALSILKDIGFAESIVAHEKYLVMKTPSSGRVEALSARLELIEEFELKLQRRDVADKEKRIRCFATEAKRKKDERERSLQIWKENQEERKERKEREERSVAAVDECVAIKVKRLKHDHASSTDTVEKASSHAVDEAKILDEAKIRFRLPCGGSLQKSFASETTSDAVFKWVSEQPSTSGFLNFELHMQYPHKKIPRSSTETMKMLGLGSSASLIVAPVHKPAAAAAAAGKSLAAAATAAAPKPTVKTKLRPIPEETGSQEELVERYREAILGSGGPIVEAVEGLWKTSTHAFAESGGKGKGKGKAGGGGTANTTNAGTRAKRLMKELKGLRKSNEGAADSATLPLHCSSSIFIRVRLFIALNASPPPPPTNSLTHHTILMLQVDEDKPQFMRALITGPDDTPYESG